MKQIFSRFQIKVDPTTLNPILLKTMTRLSHLQGTLLHFTLHVPSLHPVTSSRCPSFWSLLVPRSERHHRGSSAIGDTFPRVRSYRNGHFSGHSWTWVINRGQPSSSAFSSPQDCTLLSVLPSEPATFQNRMQV